MKNPTMSLRFSVTAFAVSLLAATLPAWAGKPSPRPTPTCSATLGQPTLAFPWDYQMYVGNPDGSCALALAQVAGQTAPAFAFTGARYRIAWSEVNTGQTKRIAQQRWVIKMVEFTMNGGNIVESRPLVVRELWRDPVTTSESSVDALAIDSSGEQVIFTRRYAGVTELKRIDLASCVAACAAPATVWVPEAGTTGFRAEFGRAGDQRIYAAQTFDDGVSRTIFIENVDGTWQGPRVIASNASGRYSGIYRFGPPSVTRFDWDGENGPEEDLVALLWSAAGGGSSAYFDVVRLGPNCTITGTEPCIDTGDATVEASGLWAGWLAYSAEWTPAGNLLRMIDPVDDIYGNDHIETIDPKTGNVLLDHGYGFHPAGLKQ